MHPLEAYLKELLRIRAIGEATDETSFYPAIEKLLNEVGNGLKPKVRCVLQIKNRSAGHPDGGLFSQDQWQQLDQDAPLGRQMPSRGVVEVKGLAEGTAVTIASKQVADYWAKYRKVLVTNYRDFALVGEDLQGNRAPGHRFLLADSVAAFWDLAAHPRAAAKERGEEFLDYLKAVLLIGARITDPQDLAWQLAYCARQALRCIRGSDHPALAAIRAALEEALSMKFTGDKGEHFFESTFVQTLFYGVFSAWVLWARRPNGARARERFDWRLAAEYLRVPILRKLFHEAAEPGALLDLGLAEVLHWAADVLNRVERAAFFSAFEERHAVQYFYEPFLEAYDPALRKELGVWYTPEEIVQYQVARVDTVLREELGVEDGLADNNVYVLDPCCGTGAYLVEVLRKIHATLQAKGGDALVAHALKRAAMERVFGFEILPAPFVISHLQLGLLLQHIGAPLDTGAKERAAVFLTNALTGWEPPKGPKQKLMFPELQQERDAADKVKRDTPILVILGNPPYNAFAGTSPEEEGGLVEPYKEGLNTPVEKGGWGIKKFNLDDLYVRFFRIAERRIIAGGQGIVCFISNFSYLSDPSFVVMRKRFLEEFDQIWIDCMNGDSRETGKLTPDGKPDPSVFSTEHNREGIRVGTSVCVLVRKPSRGAKAGVRFRHFWGASKRKDLLDSLTARRFNAQYTAVKPWERARYSFRPASVGREYMNWPKLVEFCAIPPSNGLLEKRAGALIDIDQPLLEKRMRAYYNPSVDWLSYRVLHHGLAEPHACFDPEKARAKALANENFDLHRMVRYAVRAFDTRWCYYTAVGTIWNRPRPKLWAQCWHGNAFLMARPAGVASPEGSPVFFTRVLGDNDFLRGHAYYFPFRLKNSMRLEKKDEMALFRHLGSDAELQGPVANVSARARRYVLDLGIKDPDGESGASLVWTHALAIGHSPAYLRENADGIRRDWPRIPLPATRKALLPSAGLGGTVAALLDTENGVSGVTMGNLRPEMRCLGVMSRVGGGALNPDAGDLDLTAGWGHAGKGGVTMPGSGHVEERAYLPDERAAIEAGARALGLSLDEALAHLGKSTLDVYLNGVAYWRNVPRGLWDYFIGGYQVVKKWLSYREKKLLGRGLRPDEAHYVTEMVQRLAALRLLEPALDENYRRVKANTYSFPTPP